MYKRETVRNIHTPACRGIHARVIIFKFPMKYGEHGGWFATAYRDIHIHVC